MYAEYVSLLKGTHIFHDKILYNMGIDPHMVTKIIPTMPIDQTALFSAA